MTVTRRAVQEIDVQLTRGHTSRRPVPSAVVDRRDHRAVQEGCRPVAAARGVEDDARPAPAATRRADAVRRDRPRGGKESVWVPDFERLLQTLARGGVEFIVIGGVAASAHGAIRVTRDIDVVYA